MKSLIIAVVCMLPLYSSAQKEAETEQKPVKSVQIKLYNIASITENSVQISTNGAPVYTRITSSDILHPAFAVNISNNAGNLHEIELTSLTIRQHDDKTTTTTNSTTPIPIVTMGNKVYETNIAVRYEYIINLNKKDEAKVVPAIGFAASPYYTRYHYVPYVTSAFPVKETFVGVRTFVVPRISYNMSKRIFIDLNVPVCIADAHGSFHQERNPLLPTDAQSRNTGNFDTVPKYFSLRLGVGLKI